MNWIEVAELPSVGSNPELKVKDSWGFESVIWSGSMKFSDFSNSLSSVPGIKIFKNKIYIPDLDIYISRYKISIGGN